MPERIDAARLAPTGAAGERAAEARADARRAGRRCATPISNWLYEPKLDGYRVIAFIENGDGAAHLPSRPGSTRSFFPEVVADLAAQAVDRMVLDGEIVALDADGRPSFNALQNRAQLKTPKEIAEAQRDVARRVRVLRPAAFRGPQSARRAVHRSAPLSLAMPAAVDAHSARARLR